MRILKIVPFRLASQRFPDKVLAHFFDQTILERAIEIAGRIGFGSTVLTSPAEDYDRVRSIIDVLHEDCRFVPSGLECGCATERVLELSERIPADLYVSIPADECLLDPDEVTRILRERAEEMAASPDIFSLWCRFFSRSDAASPLSAKVVADSDGRVLYMSRAVIPTGKEGPPELSRLKKHVGVYILSSNALEVLRSLANVHTVLNEIEGLEQLRWIELGLRLRVFEIRHRGFGIDIPEQIKELEERARC